MKTLLTSTAALILVSFYSAAVAQGLVRVRDPHIVAQEKRQVFQQWGNWLPKPNYNFFGIQTNVHYMLVWGWLAPQRNRDYRNGADIRPLSVGGLQNRRMASTIVQEQRTQEVLAEIRNVHNSALSEQLHYSSVTLPADPLYVLYYKPMLKKLEKFDTNTLNYSDWGFTNEKAFQRFEKLGLLGDSKRRLELLQDNLHLAKTMEIPRGKRILMFHDCLVSWRKHLSYVAYLNRQGGTAIKSQERLEKFKTAKQNGTTNKPRTDAEIFEEVYMNNPN